MVERGDRAGVALFHGAMLSVGEVELDGSAAQHALVRRVRRGDAVRLLDGKGGVGLGSVASVGKKTVSVVIERVEHSARPALLEVIVPVADRDRMLWTAEKCVELGITAWRPVMYARSRSVSPRGEGAKFAEKVRARMTSAMEQSGGAWLPDVHDESNFADALAAVPATHKRLVLDATGEPLARRIGSGPTALAVGPEGGFEPDELAAARGAGWVTASLGRSILRFETATIAGVSVIRAHQLSTQGA